LTVFIAESHIGYYNFLLVLPSTSVCFALFDPCFLAVTVGLEEIETFVAVVVVAV